MRFREFGILTEAAGLDTDPVLADLRTFLSLEAAEFEDVPDVTPEIQLDAVINAMENLGHAGFSADTLEDYFDDESLGLDNLISAISADTVTLKSSGARMPDAGADQAPVRPPEEVVGSMARRAAGRSQD